MRKFLYYLSIFIPGIFHLYLKEFKKGLSFLAVGIVEYLLLIFVIQPQYVFSLLFYSQTEGTYAGDVTIGDIPLPIGTTYSWDYDSFAILVYAVFALLFLIVVFFINYAIARNARTISNAKLAGDEPLSLRETGKLIRKDVVPLAVSTPSFVLMLLFLFVPAIISIAIAFTNYSESILPPRFLVSWVGLENFRDVFTDPVLGQMFRDSFVWTIIWTFCSAGLVIVLGIFLAVVAHDKRIKGTKFFRTVYLLPWAIPAFLTILVFQILFSKVGLMNTAVIPFLTGNEYSAETAIGFLFDPTLAKVTIILIQGWLGFPFIFMLVTGTLQAIPDDLYEASRIDGGNAWSDFWDITFPLIMQTVAPLIITQFTFAFNNVTIIYLLAGSVPPNPGSSYSPLETISSLAYRLTLESQFSQAAAITLISSIIVSIVVVFAWVRSGAFKNEEVM